MRVGFLTTCRSLSAAQSEGVEKALLRLRTTSALHIGNHRLRFDVPETVLSSRKLVIAQCEALIVVPKHDGDTQALIGQARKLGRKVVVINSMGDAIHGS